MRPLVQHHALRTLAHGSVGDLGPRRLAALGQAFQHLSGPDHGYVGRFGKPQDLLLHFRHALVAELHREVAARDHHAQARGPHAGQQQVGQLLEGAPGLDLQHDAQLGALQSSKLVPELLDVRGALHE